MSTAQASMPQDQTFTSPLFTEPRCVKDLVNLACASPREGGVVGRE